MMDLITPLPRTKRGHDAIVVFVDRFSKATHFALCSTSGTAKDLAEDDEEEVLVRKKHG
ncbi:hypothetical protein DFQ27_009810, partial [Actinomortierella ambigua]